MQRTLQSQLRVKAIWSWYLPDLPMAKLTFLAVTLSHRKRPLQNTDSKQSFTRRKLLMIFGLEILIGCVTVPALVSKHSNGSEKTKATCLQTEDILG